MSYPKEIQKELNDLAYKYAPQFKQELISAFADDRHRASGDLANSVQVRVIPATDTTSPQIVLEYEDYGDYIGARKLLYTRLPPIDQLMEWIKDKGSKFRQRNLPGYQSGSNVGISTDNQLKRIAFAIAKKIKFRQRLKSRYLWKRRALPRALKDLNTELFDSWANATEDILSKALTGKA